MRILVVDGSKAMRNIVMRAVRQAGFQATFAEAADGAQALEAIRSSPPALVLADWNMPETNGTELRENLRAEGSRVKMGFVTSESGPAIRAMAFRAGALFMLTKPFTPASTKAVLAPVVG